LARYDARVGTAQTTQAGWWVESISDGGAHYGVGKPDSDTISALCGRVFRPLHNPCTRKVERQQQPADPAHACRACKARNAP
jgi:hypothetical protein